MPTDEFYGSHYISPQLRKLHNYWKKHGTSILNKKPSFKVRKVKNG